MNHLIRKRFDPTRVFLYILFIILLLAISVTTAASDYTITATAVGPGTIEPGSATVNPGGSYMFTISAEPGYQGVLLVDGVKTPYAGVYTVSNVNKNYVLSVTFVPETGSLEVKSNPVGVSILIDGDTVGNIGKSGTTWVYDVSVGTHELRLVLAGYNDYTTTVTLEKGKTTKVDKDLAPQTPVITPISTTVVPTITKTVVPTVSTTVVPTITKTVVPTASVVTTPTGQISVVVPERTTVPTALPAGNQTNQTNTTPIQVTSGTLLPVTPAVNLTQDPGTNNTSVPGPVVTSPRDNRTNGTGNVTGTGGLIPPMGLPPQNVMMFLFIALIPLLLLIAHDYLGLGHMVFPQPLTIRVGVAFGQVACAVGLLFVLLRMVTLLPEFTNLLALPLLIVLLFGAYLIFSALALAIGSLLSRPLRWTLKVHVVIGVITLIVTLILLFWHANGDLMSMIMAILVTIVAAPVSALLALWQDHSLALEVHKHRFPFDLFNGDETRITSGTDPYRRSTATRPDIFPPELADRYTSIDFLGMGGISHVFRAMRLKDGMTVAVKIPIRFDDTTGKCFLKEIRAWEGLSHPNIVEITEANILPIPFVEMEFVKSGLVDIKTPLPVRDAAEIISGVAEGLAYAHEQGIIHRDIKPHNILIDSHGVPKISDWGMSRLIGSSATQTVAGFSLAYAAPEQVSPKRFGETDERTDIYQLGVVFYELVTGKLLFPGDDLAEVSNAIISKMPVPPSEVNPLARPIDPIILKCLQKKPEDRYQSVRMLILDLKQFLGSKPDTRDYDSLFDEKGGEE
ncbi:MAG: protein kinase [Methanomicrobiales archaeon]|nr:protein kinase [Methanomicrobiales archaeon]